MRVIVQRVLNAKCIVDQEVVGKCQHGLLLLVAFTEGDTLDFCQKMAEKVANLRIFNDSEDKMNLSVKDVKGSILSISQFTLYGDAKKGHRPSFINSLRKEEAEPLYLAFNDYLNNQNIPTEGGSFGNHMNLEVNLDGPVTISLEL